jgi:hypothetical protein
MYMCVCTRADFHFLMRQKRNELFLLLNFVSLDRPKHFNPKKESLSLFFTAPYYTGAQHVCDAHQVLKRQSFFWWYNWICVDQKEYVRIIWRAFAIHRAAAAAAARQRSALNAELNVYTLRSKLKVTETNNARIRTRSKAAAPAGPY